MTKRMQPVCYKCQKPCAGTPGAVAVCKKCRAKKDALRGGATKQLVLCGVCGKPIPQKKGPGRRKIRHDDCKKLRPLRVAHHASCERCGADIEYSGRAKKYCSSACRLGYPGPAGSLRVCPVCTETFEANTTAHRYCSFRCRDKGSRWWRYFHLTPAEVRYLFDNQDGACAICRKPLDFLEAAMSGWVIDHNHATKEVRGILCIGCNTGLGGLKDDPAICIAAANYLSERGSYGSRQESQTDRGA